MKLGCDPPCQGGRILPLRSLPPQRRPKPLQVPFPKNPRCKQHLLPLLSKLCFFLPSPQARGAEPCTWPRLIIAIASVMVMWPKLSPWNSTLKLLLELLDKKKSTRLVRQKPGVVRHHLCQRMERAHLRMKPTQRKAGSWDEEGSPAILPWPLDPAMPEAVTLPTFQWHKTIRSALV